MLGALHLQNAFKLFILKDFKHMLYRNLALVKCFSLRNARLFAGENMNSMRDVRRNKGL